jgi:peroxiredoxin
MILRELVTRLGFELDDKNLKKFEQSIDDAKTKLAGFGKSINAAKFAITGLVAAATGLTVLSLSVAKAAKETEDLASKLGITTDDLQSLELVAQDTGLEVNELSKSFASFNKQLGTIDTSSKIVTDELNRLNISTKDNNGNLKSSFVLYEEAAKKIAAIKDPIKQAAVSQRLLGTSNKEVAKLFDTTNEAFQKQREEITRLGYVIDSKGIQSSKEFIKSWNNLRIIIDGVKKELAVKFMPVFSRTIDMFKTWYVANRKIISQSITSFINILSAAFSFLFKAINLVLTPVKYLINLLGGLENTVNVLSITLGILAIPRILAAASAVRVLTVALLANPVTWVTAAIIALSVAIALIIDDLIAWATGNTSLIATLLKEWFGFEKTFDEIIDSVVSFFKDSFESLGKWFTSFFDGILDTIKTITNFVGSGIDAVREKTIFRKVVSEEERQVKVIQADDKLNTIKDDSVKADLERKETILRKIELVNEDNLDEPRVRRQIQLIDESNLNDELARPNNLQPLINPSSSINGVSPVNNNSTANNKVNQYITENIVVNVPVGTTAEQSRIIADQVTNVFQEQFNYNILRGLDSLSSR